MTTESKPTAPAEVLSSLVQSFPGLVDGEQDVNGADVVNFLSEHRGTLEALAARAEGAKRRRAKPKQEFILEASVTYRDVTQAAEVETAIKKFIRRRRIKPEWVEGPDGIRRILFGLCGISGRAIFSDDDRGLRPDPHTPTNEDGDPNFETVLHAHADDWQTYIPVFFRGANAYDTGQALPAVQANSEAATADLRARAPQPTGRRFASVDEVVEKTCPPDVQEGYRTLRDQTGHLTDEEYDALIAAEDQLIPAGTFVHFTNSDQTNQGKTVTAHVERIITKAEERFDQEVLPMYELKLQGGTIVLAFPDEVKEIPSVGTVMAAEARAACNNLSQEERDRLLGEAMKLCNAGGVANQKN